MAAIFPTLFVFLVKKFPSNFDEHGTPLAALPFSFLFIYVSDEVILLRRLEEQGTTVAPAFKIQMELPISVWVSLFVVPGKFLSHL